MSVEFSEDDKAERIRQLPAYQLMNRAREALNDRVRDDEAVSTKTMCDELGTDWEALQLISQELSISKIEHVLEISKNIFALIEMPILTEDQKEAPLKIMYNELHKVVSAGILLGVAIGIKSTQARILQESVEGADDSKEADEKS